MKPHGLFHEIETGQTTAWRRSKKGNLWRMWKGLTLTIYERGWFYHWCVADKDGPHYSPQGYMTVKQAIHALAEELAGELE